ncbi:unnamed protein product [Didymodactylos carnosus]|uniref:Major facilitator superfamily (MFS) profile domain-containing protein n=1 Tax=Didymodactylos carnosus TaxID=1234261 RepID=A0A8S2JBD5_9BILA|nr:unnamed protein product [Didymodactylos carnosus]CAF3803056.1 unnamed protein product [Didymodactylos carnosus]
MTEPTTTAPDGGWGYVIVFCSFMIHVVIDGITYSMGSVYLEKMLESANLDAKHSVISAIFSILPAIYMLSGKYSPIATILTTRYGCRLVTITGACVGSLGFFMCYWYEHIYWYWLGIGLIGAIVSVTNYFDRKRSLAMGFAVSGAGCGTMIFPKLMPWFLKHLNGYRKGLLVESAIIFSCILFGLLMKPLPWEPSELRKKSKSKNMDGYVEEEETALQVLNNGLVSEKAGNKDTKNKLIDLSLLSNIPFVLFLISNFLTNFGFNVPYAFTEDLAMHDGIKKSHAEYITMTIGIGSIAGRIIIGFLGDRNNVNRLTLYNFTLIIVGVATVLEALVSKSNLVLHLIYGATFGFFTGGYISLIPTVLVDLAGLDKMSNAFGFVLLVQGIAIAIGLPFVGFLREKIGTYLVPYIIIGLVIALSGIMLFIIPFLKKPSKSLSITKTEIVVTPTGNSDIDYCKSIPV